MRIFTRYGLLSLAAAVAAVFLAASMARLGMTIADVSAESGQRAGYDIHDAAAALPGAWLLHLVAVLALLALIRSAFRDVPTTLCLRLRRAMRGAALVLVVGVAKVAYLLTAGL